MGQKSNQNRAQQWHVYGHEQNTTITNQTICTIGPAKSHASHESLTHSVNSRFSARLSFISRIFFCVLHSFVRQSIQNNLHELLILPQNDKNCFHQAQFRSKNAQICFGCRGSISDPAGKLRVLRNFEKKDGKGP